MGILILVVLLASETMLLAWSAKSKDLHIKEQSVVRIILAGLFGLLLFTGVAQWSFRYGSLALFLGMQAAAGAVAFFRKSQRPYHPRKQLLHFVLRIALIAIAAFPAILFPQYTQPKMTGAYPVQTAKYTWTDPGRQDPFGDAGQDRALTVEFWYPDSANGEWPLVVFSHGAFGFSGSNYSTFAELASNGYVVASIGHTHHAFYTLSTDGQLTTADKDFIAEAAEINAAVGPDSKAEVYTVTRDWLTLRTDDINFIIGKILDEAGSEGSVMPFSAIDKEKIGLMGHSLGGAASAQLGRERRDIDAVIVLDGTMLGEEISFNNSQITLDPAPYPVPLLNVYAEDHYTSAREAEGDAYDNFHASSNALCAYETVFSDAGHLNFTDLPLFSPILAGKLGIGTIDARYCIETMNQVVLAFFNGYLKDAGIPDIAEAY